ncbi:uncharacterized protein LOC143501258 [Brachyhypopomus gauderio]|uniref:uncharacterized protein LOC143501258 n=1 Tax=Brachyhypopomus gauderio TaxID=698409 RepID=UPI0040416FD9
MALRATSHGDMDVLVLSKPSTSDSGVYRSYSGSSNSVGGRLGKEGAEEMKEASRRAHPPRRPVRAVRPMSALGAGGSYLQINHLQGELVRKRKECEDLKKENKYLSSEIHMERIMMRTENELTMRNLRNLNQELQGQVKELKQKLHLSQQRAALCSRAAEEADAARGQAERGRTLAETRATESGQERDRTLAENTRLKEELQDISKEHTNVQLSLAQTEKNHFESKLKLEKVSGEKQVLLAQNKSLEDERNALRHRLRQQTEESVKIKEREAGWRRRAEAAEEQSERAGRAALQAEQERKMAEREREARSRECLSWREKHQDLADAFRTQEDLKSQRQNKACQANIKSYFLCMTESDQRVKILKNQDGTPRNFTEGDPVYISTSEESSKEPDRISGRTILRVAAPTAGRDAEHAHFSDLPSVGADRHDNSPVRRNRKVVEYFWIPTEEE